jgi:hypothetical protein
MNVTKQGARAIYHSVEHKREYRSIEWLPVSDEYAAPAELMLEDATVAKGVVERDLVDAHHPDDVLQFERVGFVRYDRKEGDTYHFWFTHR